MTSYAIRPLHDGDDLNAQRELSDRVFGTMTGRKRESWLEKMRDVVADGRYLGVFDGERPAGAAMFYDFQQWWLGRSIPVAGVAGVKMAAEHRGRGAGRALMRELLDVIAGRGYPLAVLYPLAVPLYRSLGWELAGGRYRAVIPSHAVRELAAPDPAVVADTAPDADAPDEVPLRHATPDDLDEVLAMIARVHTGARDCGPILHRHKIRDWLADRETYTYLAKDGFLAYTWRAKGELYVYRALGASPGTIRALWDLIGSHAGNADAFGVVTAPSDPFWWLTRERDAKLSSRVLWMLRVVDPPAAIGARGFPPGVTVSVPLVIHDSQCRANSGQWQLTIGGGTGALTRDGQGNHGRPGVVLGPRGLAALYAGVQVSTLRRAGLATGGDAVSDAALDSAFAATPFMLDAF